MTTALRSARMLASLVRQARAPVTAANASAHLPHIAIVSSHISRFATQTDPPATSLDTISTRAVEWHDRGLDRWNRGDISGALEAFEKSVWTKPTSDALYNLGNCFYAKGQHDKALGQWIESVKLQPRSDAHVNIANIHVLVKKDLASALPHYRAALDISPEDGEIHYNYACVLDAHSAKTIVESPSSSTSSSHEPPMPSDTDIARLEEAISHYVLAKKYGVKQAENNLRNAMAKLVGAQTNRIKKTSKSS